jgi:ectoine hydroxylase-related dioxygenase (phytanoyl-CoA dioxygenase family)
MKNIKNSISIYGTLFYIIIILLVLIVCFLIYVIFFDKNKLSTNETSYNLNEHGLCVIKEIFGENELTYLKNECSRENYKKVKETIMGNKVLQNTIRGQLGEEYIFQDYIFIIKKSAIHTCHRDANGDFFNEKQMYPSYTMLIFLEDMEKCLGVIPKSHKNINSHNFNFTENITNVICNKGDVILFNANLIHVGALTSRDDNLRIQMKITHKNDIPAMGYYNNYNKVLNENNNMPFYIRKIQQKMSCMFPIISNYTQNKIQKDSNISKTKQDINIIDKIYSYLMHGNSNFYNLPNAF